MADIFSIKGTDGETIQKGRGIVPFCLGDNDMMCGIPVSGASSYSMYLGGIEIGINSAGVTVLIYLADSGAGQTCRGQSGRAENAVSAGRRSSGP